MPTFSSQLPARPRTATWYVAEQRKRYRKRAPPDRVSGTGTPHEAFDAQARWQRIAELNDRLTELLPDEARETWQALEQALHVHWLDVAVAHYNRGFASGAAQSWVASQLGQLGEELAPHDKLLALATALMDLAQTLERPPTKLSTKLSTKPPTKQSAEHAGDHRGVTKGKDPEDSSN